MTIYLDITMVRIQEYLDRSTKLWERRHASHAIVEATDEDAICAGLTGLEPHHEAGEADGKLHFTVADGTPPAQILDELYSRLRRALPEAQFEGWWQRADSYVRATDAARASRANGSPPNEHAGWMSSLPAVCELPIAKRCEACATAGAVNARPDPDGRPRWLCVDCLTRQGGRLTPWRSSAARPPMREQQLADAVDRHHGTKLALATEFSRLRPDWDGETTDDTPAGRGAHHATIHFDGNSLGALFHAVPDPVTRADLSAAVTEAVWTALEQATVGCHDPKDRNLLVQPHIIGGDDLLLTVWAPRAWAFARRFTSSFNTALAKAHDRLDLADRVAAPTISGGIVIAPATFPFSHARALAEDLLGTAKASHPGASAFGWLDVTYDGDRLPANRKPVSLTTLDQLDAALHELAAVPASTRSSLARAARANRLGAETKRLGQGSLAEEFSEATLSLPDALILTRWLR